MRDLKKKAETFYMAYFSTGLDRVFRIHENGRADDLGSSSLLGLFSAIG